MEIIVYIVRCLAAVLITWLAIRIIGKKSISQITSYDFAAISVIANVASEPLVFKITTKSFVGCVVLALAAVGIGILSLNKRFYNFDSKPDIIILNGKIDKKALKRNRMNLPFLLSMLRSAGYGKVTDVEFAIIEPDGSFSVIPTSQSRPVTPKDLKIKTEYEGLSLPLIIDGKIQYNNLLYAKLDTDWLRGEMGKAGISRTEEVFLAELDTEGNLYFDKFIEEIQEKPAMF